ncbi:MAG: D-alanyl-D-alanine carboxypeptidase family protein [Erysipelotrichaceae bacterium]|nr:D-alanyl-D-alanine carboxypeptidase family protein [Erysipelotrichaceae bacterium]MDY5252349.1 D-alanyl-D-alanine carboxypeptidase family protein [Erysipelotrichaceae bacterium]
MEKQKHLFVSCLLVIALACVGIMNIKYDRLSRYPYQDEESRKIIDEYLSDEEIEYIIEYSIAPNVFISFIDVEGFNIYHASEYKHLSNLLWQEKPENIVGMVEATRNYISVDQLYNLLNNYKYNEIIYFYEFKDMYNPQSILVENAKSVDAYLDDTYTVGIRVPTNLETIDQEKINTSQDIQLETSCAQSLYQMCVAMEASEEFAGTKCGGMEVKQGYVSYDQQKALYDEMQKNNPDISGILNYPGHDEHQLGLAVDLSVEGLDQTSFYKTSQYQWLLDNAYKYGFVQTYTDQSFPDTQKSAKPYHFRYVGVAMATHMHDNNLTLKQALGK